MESKEVFSYLMSGAIGLCSLFFEESIKEIIRKFFSIKSKNKIRNFYWFVFILVISLPILIFYFTSEKVNKGKLKVGLPVEKIQPTQLSK